jgi:hypothetical protein
MARLAAVLVLASYATLQVWGQASSERQAATQPASGEQRAGDPNQPSETDSSVPAPPVTATTKSPLDQFQDFSAIQNGGPLPGMDADRHIYRAGNVMRMQGDASVPEYYITDLAKQQSHDVSVRGCLQMGSAYKLSFPFFLSGPSVTYDRIPIGKETVDGHSCQVEDLVIHNPKNPVIMHFRLYEAEDLQGFPIKIENRREQAYPWVIRYKEVRLGSQDPSLFLVPDKCQTMAGFQKIGPGAKPKTTPSAKHQ